MLAIITACLDWRKLLLSATERGDVVETDGRVGPGPGLGGEGGPWLVEYALWERKGVRRTTEEQRARRQQKRQGPHLGTK